MVRAAEKQKEGVEGLLAPINRPPLRGLSPWPTMKSGSQFSAESRRGCLAQKISGKNEAKGAALPSRRKASALTDATRIPVVDWSRHEHATDSRTVESRCSDGTRVPVSHPDFVAVSPGQIVVIASRTEGITRVDPLHVVAIEQSRRKKSKNHRNRHR